MLGSGSFGKVYLVDLDFDANNLYALKVMSKKNIYRRKQTEFVLGECSILSEVNHPMLLQLTATFQNDFSLFILSPYYPGGNLHTILKKSPNCQLDLDTTVFYCACLLDSLVYMHSLNIIHRDVKSENVMIDEKGYLVLIDFGFAKKYHYKTYTVCGTPFYMAPEILLSKGYDAGIDYWAMGVVFYEMLIGYEPFYADDEMGLYREICACRYYLPTLSEGMDPSASNFIKSLFTRSQKRLGCLSGGSNQIRQHPIFKNIDWKALRLKEVDAPVIPSDAMLHSSRRSKKALTKPIPIEEKLPAVMSRKFESFGPFIENPPLEGQSIPMLPQAKPAAKSVDVVVEKPVDSVQSNCCCTIC